jgi:hypothetical protein
MKHKELTRTEYLGRDLLKNSLSSVEKNKKIIRKDQKFIG